MAKQIMSLITVQLMDGLPSNPKTTNKRTTIIHLIKSVNYTY